MLRTFLAAVSVLGGLSGCAGDPAEDRPVAASCDGAWAGEDGDPCTFDVCDERISPVGSECRYSSASCNDGVLELSSRVGTCPSASCAGTMACDPDAPDSCADESHIASCEWVSPCATFVDPFACSATAVCEESSSGATCVDHTLDDEPRCALALTFLLDPEVRVDWSGDRVTCEVTSNELGPVFVIEPTASAPESDVVRVRVEHAGDRTGDGATVTITLRDEAEEIEWHSSTADCFMPIVRSSLVATPREREELMRGSVSCSSPFEAAGVARGALLDTLELKAVRRVTAD